MHDPRQSDLLAVGREIWQGTPPMSLEHVAVAAATVVGDIARLARGQWEGEELDRLALAKELGNLMLSAPRWADDLGLDTQECLDAADDAQRRYTDTGPAE